MIEKPALLVMAAGMGSRYGGLKQIDPITEQGEIILDFSLYDAMLAGFEDVVFVIKKENEEAFRALMDERAGTRLNIHYAFQDLADIPAGFEIPARREKPWGTGHAVLSARNIIGGPFAVINADDYYGSTAFQQMYDFLASSASSANDSSDVSSAASTDIYSMVAFKLSNTLSESGHVARGVCTVSEDGKLLDICERTMIKRIDDEAIGFSEDGGETWTFLSGDTPVSMNFWGFTGNFMAELENGFPEFLKSVPESADPLKAEYFLPGAVDRLLKEGKAEVKVLRSSDKWYGVTYKDDKESVVSAIRQMKDAGLYPEILWR